MCSQDITSLILAGSIGLSVFFLWRLTKRLVRLYDRMEKVLYPPSDTSMSELPDWDDLRGSAPDATGSLSSEAFIRRLRDDWDR